MNSNKIEVPINKILHDYQFEMNRIRKENDELRNSKDLAEKNYHIVMNDNNNKQQRLHATVIASESDAPCLKS